MFLQRRNTKDKGSQDLPLHNKEEKVECRKHGSPEFRSLYCHQPPQKKSMSTRWCFGLLLFITALRFLHLSVQDEQLRKRLTRTNDTDNAAESIDTQDKSNPGNSDAEAADGAPVNNSNGTDNAGGGG